VKVIDGWMWRWIRLSFSKTLKENIKDIEMFISIKTAFECSNKNISYKSERKSTVQGKTGS